MRMIAVSNPVELMAALAGAVAGSTILLAPGNYEDVSLKNFAFSDYVTLQSADPEDPAVFESLFVQSSSYLRFDGIKVEHVLEHDEPDWVSAMRIDKSHHIEITNSEFTGCDDSDYTNDGQGLLVLDSSNVLLSGNTFHDLKTAAGFGRSELIEAHQNSFYDIRSDGLNFGAVSHVVVEGNSFTDFHPAAGDHPDMIQFFNNGATEDMTDVTIRGNVLTQGNGAAVQGIFVQGVPPGETETADHAATRFIIESNTIELGSAQGIWVSDVDGLQIADNIITATDDGALTPSIRTMRTSDTNVTGNTAPSIEDVDSVNIAYSENNVTANGDTGTDGDDVIYGDGSNNEIEGGAGADEIHGVGGNDTLAGGSGIDRLFGEAGNDSLAGGEDDDMLNGGAGRDVLHGGSGDDGFFGGGGNDRIYGESGNDTMYGDGGNDTLNGGSGSDVLYGGSGNDGFFGGGGDDLIYGQAGTDTLFGNGGNDTLSGGTGDDKMYGGSGSDTFVIEAGGGNETIMDFNSENSDVLQFVGTTFTTVGDVLAAATQVGTTTIVTVDDETSVRLENFTLTELNESDVLL